MKAQRFDDVFGIIGGQGAFQWCLFIQTLIVAFMSVETIYMNFVGFEPEHWCLVPELQHLPHQLQKDIAIPYDDDADDELVYDSCNVFKMNWTQYDDDDFLDWNRTLMTSHVTETVKCENWVYDKSVMISSAVMDWDIVCGNSWLIELVSTLTLTGFLFGSILCGIISDRYGRRVAIGGLTIIKIASSFLAAFAPEYWVLALARFILGIGAVGVYIVSFVLLMETSGPAVRTWFGMMFHLMFGMGFALTAVFAYALRDYFNLQLVMAVQPLVIIPIFLVIPESPRWLILQGRLKEADHVIRWIASVNNKIIPDDFDVSHIQIERNPADDSKASCTDLFKSARLRRYTLILYIIWFTVNLLYYALSLNAASLAGDVFLNTFLLGAIELPAQFIGVICLDIAFLGRRWTNGGSLIIAGIASLISVPLLLTTGESAATTAMALVGKAGATISFNAMYVFTSEIYPTEVRNVGLGSCSMTARFSGILAPFIGGSFADIWEPLPSLIFGVSGSLSGLLVLLLPETVNRTLPETVNEMEHMATGNRISSNIEVATNGKTSDLTKDPPHLESTAL